MPWLAPGAEGWWEDDVAFMEPWGFELGSIRTPVLLYHGRQDRFVPFAHGEWLARQIPGVQAELTDDDGQILPAHSISAGLDYPGVGPEHAWLKQSGRARYVAVTDADALAGLQLLARTEGILCALETAHAIAHLPALATTLPAGAVIVVALSGRGDKDMPTVAKALGVDA